VTWNKEVVATVKNGFNNKGEVYDVERGGPAGIHSPYRLTDESVSSSSWCYAEGIGHDGLTALVHALIGRIGKNGTTVLNIAPMTDGTIPAGQRSLILGIGTTPSVSVNPSTPPGPGPCTARG
jgi:alpha-L-fucosidase